MRTSEKRNTGRRDGACSKARIASFTCKNTYWSYDDNLDVSLDERITENIFASKLQRFVFREIERLEKDEIYRSEEFQNASYEDDKEFGEKVVEFYNSKNGSKFSDYYGKGGFYDSVGYDERKAYETLALKAGLCLIFHKRQKYVMANHFHKDFLDSYRLLISLIKNEDLKKELENELKEDK